MINALASVPFVIWGLEWSWETGRWRGVVLGAFALACQVFAGHLQDVLLTSGIVGLYGLYRVATEPAGQASLAALGDGRRRSSGWGSCSRRCSGSRPRSCSTARPAPGG